MDAAEFGPIPKIPTLDYVGETEKHTVGVRDGRGHFGPRFDEAADYLRFELRD